MERRTDEPIHGGHTGDIPQNSVLVEYDETKISSARITELTYWLNTGDSSTPERNIIYDVGESEVTYISDYSTYLDNLIAHTPEDSRKAQTAVELQDKLLYMEEQLTDNLSIFIENEDFEGALDLLFEQKVIPPRCLLEIPDSVEYIYAPSGEKIFANDLENEDMFDSYEDLFDIIESGDLNEAMRFAIRACDRIPELSLASMCVDWDDDVSESIENDIPEWRILEQIKFRDILALYCTLTEARGDRNTT